MENVREKYAQLQDAVGSLSEKITAVLMRQEKDFLAAYRAHMYNVQKELHDTKEKVTRNETTENKSEKIKLLEDERDWYVPIYVHDRSGIGRTKKAYSRNASIIIKTTATTTTCVHL
jgi:hypothetical protein